LEFRPNDRWEKLKSTSISVQAQQVDNTGNTPTCTVTFKDGTTTLGSGTITAGVATLSTNALAMGTHSITAVYAGDANNAASTRLS